MQREIYSKIESNSTKDVGFMTEKQYERANKCLLPVLIILYGVFLLLSVAIILESGVKISGVVQLQACR